MNELFKQIPIKVYIKINERKEIINVNSSIFIEDTTGWIEIDEGFGDKYAHAQTQYFDEPITNEEGNYNYCYEENLKVISEVQHE